jgi:hypothetical protein
MDVLQKPILYICTFFVAAILRNIGFFNEHDSAAFSKIVMNFTLPAAIVASFCSYERDPALFLIIPIGFLFGILPLLLMFVFTKKLPKSERVFYMVNVGGINIGGFTLPMIQAFFGASMAIPCCVFDVGNAIMMSGGSYAVTSTLLDTEEHSQKPTFAQNMVMLCKRLFSNFALDVYLLMLVLMLINVQVPAAVGSFLSPIAGASGFASMLMVGSMFTINKNPEFIKSICNMVCIKLILSVIGALIFYFALPFNEDIRKILVLTAFSPIGALAPVYTKMCHGDGAKASCANSVMIIISFVIITILALFM